jgi:hypothetical protein
MTTKEYVDSMSLQCRMTALKLHENKIFKPYPKQKEQFIPLLTSGQGRIQVYTSITGIYFTLLYVSKIIACLQHKC